MVRTSRMADNNQTLLPACTQLSSKHADECKDYLVAAQGQQSKHGDRNESKARCVGPTKMHPTHYPIATHSPHALLNITQV
jgi:hypothetical protein